MTPLSMTLSQWTLTWCFYKDINFIYRPLYSNVFTVLCSNIIFRYCTLLTRLSCICFIHTNPFHVMELPKWYSKTIVINVRYSLTFNFNIQVDVNKLQQCWYGFNELNCFHTIKIQENRGFNIQLHLVFWFIDIELNIYVYFKHIIILNKEINFDFSLVSQVFHHSLCFINYFSGTGKILCSIHIKIITQLRYFSPAICWMYEKSSRFQQMRLVQHAIITIKWFECVCTVITRKIIISMLKRLSLRLTKIEWIFFYYD